MADDLQVLVATGAKERKAIIFTHKKRPAEHRASARRFLCKGYKKDIFDRGLMGFELYDLGVLTIVNS